MTYVQILQSIKQKKFAPIYFLFGEEAYFIDSIVGELEKNVLTDDEKAFNQTILYGKETSIGQIVESAKRYPMMSEYQTVIVKEAQNITKDWAHLESYAAEPSTTTVLVFAYKYKKPDGRLKIFKDLKKSSVFFESKKIYQNQLPSFIQEVAQQMGVSIKPDAIAVLADCIGTDLGRISSEINKLKIAVPNAVVNKEDILEHIGINKEYNNFELRTAIGNRDALKVYRIIKYFSENPKDNPVVLTTATLHAFFTQIMKYHVIRGQAKGEIAKQLGINPFFISEIDQAARNHNMKNCSQAFKSIQLADAQSKGVGSGSMKESEIYKELVYSILN